MILRFTAIAGAWLCLTSSTAAMAQGQRKVVDENGIDLMSGGLSLSETDLRIGPTEGGLALQRSVGEDIERISHNWLVMISGDEGPLSPSLTVSAGGSSKTFNYNGTSWVDPDATGETLSVNTSVSQDNALFTDRNGAKFFFQISSQIFYGSRIEYPNGYKIHLAWQNQYFVAMTSMTAMVL
jgi:hypothetical protein